MILATGCKMLYYPAIIMPAIDGGYKIIFPDIPEAFSQGGNLEETLAMGQRALDIAIEEYARVGRKKPEPSNLERAQQFLHAELEFAGTDKSREPLIKFFPARTAWPEIDLERENRS